MRGLREPSPKLNNALYFLAGVLTVVLVFVIVVGVQTMAQGTRQDYAAGAPETDGQGQDAPMQTTPVEEPEEAPEKWQEGVIEYKGGQYRYNSNIRTYLIMGIDKDEPVSEAPDFVSGGQSDAMFLLVVDSANEKLSVISINRNTMTDIEMYDESGNFISEVQAQICLQHAFGDGRKLSCSRTTDVVAKLFGNIPISGYVAMNMGGIPMMNDAVGGVEVTVLQDVIYPNKGVDLREGETVNLGGEEAYCYLRGRDVTEYDSASDRLRREEQYIVNYMAKLKAVAGGNSAMVVGVYNSVSDYLVTSVDFTDLVTELMDYDFSEDQMYTVPGETVMGDQYEEYYVDEDALLNLIMEVFYVPV